MTGERRRVLEAALRKTEHGLVPDGEGWFARFGEEEWSAYQEGWLP